MVEGKSNSRGVETGEEEEVEGKGTGVLPGGRDSGSSVLRVFKG